jgi:serine phosphatase RsbU (regulator of sigma subunit)/pSer/pThr/pTyr-binding forkhead associated (FHA) protein
MASLLIKSGPCVGQRLQLTRLRISLGRHPDSDIPLGPYLEQSPAGVRDAGTSRYHAVISRSGAEYTIADGDGRGVPSRNGTYVNGHAVPAPPAQVPLRNGDLIHLGRQSGSFSCIFLLDECSAGEDDEGSLQVLSSLAGASSERVLGVQPAEQLRILLEVSKDLSHTLDLDALLPRILDHLLRLFRQADRGFVLLCEGPNGQPVVRAFKARPGDGADERVSLTIIRRCVENVEAVLAGNAAQQFPASASLAGLSVRSLMCAPLWAQDGRALGAIQLDSSGAFNEFSEDDLKLLMGVAAQASVALAAARLHSEGLLRQQRERDLAVARDIQLALLPQSLPALSGHAFHSCYKAAQEVGGDYYDFVPLSGGRLAVVVGDVAGKGVPAALVMAKFSVEARVCLEAEPDLATAVRRLNEQMCRANLPERFVALTAAVFDPAESALRVLSAGNPSPVIYRAASALVEQAVPPSGYGPPMGLFPGAEYAASSVHWGPGDGLVLFSDGVTEAMNASGEMFGDEGVRSALESGGLTAIEAGEKLLNAVQMHAAGWEQSDDIVLVCVGRTG